MRGLSLLPIPALLPRTGLEVFELFRPRWARVNTRFRVGESFRTFSNGLLKVNCPLSGLMEGRWMGEVASWWALLAQEFQDSGFRVRCSGIWTLPYFIGRFL